MRKSQDLWVSTTPAEASQAVSDVAPARVSKKNGKKKDLEYIDLTCTLDIETTSPDKNDGFMYAIQFNVGGVNAGFRYIEDFIEFVNFLTEKWSLSRFCRLVFYVHNLGFEHMFLTQIFDKHWHLNKILLTKKRKPLTILFSNGVELRDSYKLFQKGLEGATKGLPHAKLKGDLDYRAYRTPDTPLSPDEWNYCINDVQGLYEAIERIKTERGFNQATIPLTNTGIVIKEVNDACYTNPEYRKAVGKLILTKRQLTLGYQCMGGGDTHGSRWKSGRVYENCNSNDFKSAHPGQQLLRKFPSGKPIDLPPDVTEKELNRLINSDYGWLGKVYIGDFKCRPECPNPTISLSKTEDIEGLLSLDNGRVMGAKGAFIYMDSNDYQRFKEAYTYKVFIGVDIYAFKLEYLPKVFRETIKSKFIIKETAADGPDRNFAKICVNTIFGACAQKVVRDEYELGDMENLDAETTHWQDNMEKLTESVVHTRQAQKFPFLWGLWTSSLTRLYLFKLIKAIGWNNIIYWDTDSGKYEGKPSAAIDEFNREIIAQCEARDAVVMKKGKPVYIMYAENEHPDVEYGYRRFTFLHAKCYACESFNKNTGEYEIETTIAGVGKTEGIKAMRGDISNLKEGLKISPAGGLALTYVDLPIYERKFKRVTECASFIHMDDREYEVKCI